MIPSINSQLVKLPKASRFASQPINNLANQAKDVIDITADQVNTAVKKPGLLSKVLYPFTKIGQVVIGMFKAIGGFIGNIGNGIKSTAGHFFKKPAVSPDLPPKPMDALASPVALTEPVNA